MGLDSKKNAQNIALLFDGSAEHIVHLCRKSGVLNECLKQIELLYSLHAIVTSYELSSYILNTMVQNVHNMYITYIY